MAKRAHSPDLPRPISTPPFRPAPCLRPLPCRADRFTLPTVEENRRLVPLENISRRLGEIRMGLEEDARSSEEPPSTSLKEMLGPAFHDSERNPRSPSI